jgi:hypothetical protein
MKGLFLKYEIIIMRLLPFMRISLAAAEICSRSPRGLPIGA